MASLLSEPGRMGKKSIMPGWEGQELGAFWEGRELWRGSSRR